MAAPARQQPQQLLRYPSWKRTDKADPCPPRAGQRWGRRRRSRAGSGEIPEAPFTKLISSFPSPALDSGGVGDPKSQHTENPPFSPTPRPLPALPVPLCLPGTRWSVAGAELLALGRPGHGQLGLLPPGRADGRQGTERPAERHGGKLLFCCLELLFRVSRASRGLWEREQRCCGGGSVQPSSGRAQGGALSCSGIALGQAGLGFGVLVMGKDFKSCQVQK